MLVDTHCHLADSAFAEDRDEVLVRAKAAGVGHVVVIGDTMARSEDAIRLATQSPQLSATVGIHPHHAGDWNPDAAAWLEQVLESPVVVGVGEMGLDYYYDLAPRSAQVRAFDAQMAIAASAGKPAVIHAREADQDVAALLRNHPTTRVVMHSFSSGRELLETALELGHYVSFSGMVTFRNWEMDDVVARVPLDRLVLETDAPYLAPVPHRGRRNEPAFVGDTARRVADIRRMPLSELVRATGENAVALFGSRISATS